MWFPFLSPKRILVTVHFHTLAAGRNSFFLGQLESGHQWVPWAKLKAFPGPWSDLSHSRRSGFHEREQAKSCTRVAKLRWEVVGTRQPKDVDFMVLSEGSHLIWFMTCRGWDYFSRNDGVHPKCFFRQILNTFRTSHKIQSQPTPRSPGRLAVLFSRVTGYGKAPS